MMKRSFAIILAVALAALLFPVTALANSYSLGLSGASTIYAGNTVSYTVSVRPGSDGCAGFQGKLTYDTGVLEYKSISKKVPSGWSFTPNVSGGSITFVGYDSSASNPYTSSKSAFTVTFAVKSAAVGTTAKVSVTPTGSGGGGGDSVTSTVSKPLSGNNNLSSLSVSSYTLSPSFSPDKTEYSLSVPYSVSSIDVKAAAADSLSSVSISGASSLQEAATNAVRVTVTAENGKKKVYTISVTRGRNPDTPKGNDNTLKGLAIDQGQMFPVFAPDVLNYTAYVTNEISAIGITPTVNDQWASARVDGDGTLKVGSNKINIIVTAENGDTQTYTINVIRGYDSRVAGFDNATLTSLAVDGMTFSPEFSSDVFTYHATLTAVSKELAVNVVPKFETSTVSVFGANEFEEATSGSISVVVTAADGTICVYRIVVDVCTPEMDATLASLTTSTGSLSPEFNKDTLFYTLDKGEAKNSEISLEAQASSSNATVEFVGLDEVKAGLASSCSVIVTAQNGNKRAYVVSIAGAEAAAETNANPTFLGGFGTTTILIGAAAVLILGIAVGMLILKIVQKVYNKRKDDNPSDDI